MTIQQPSSPDGRLLAICLAHEIMFKPIDNQQGQSRQDLGSRTGVKESHCTAKWVGMGMGMGHLITRLGTQSQLFETSRIDDAYHIRNSTVREIL